jgi:CheY-like chemotaxis protein
VMASSLRLARHVTKNSARVVCDFQEVLPIVAGESRLGQVFLNLLVNAAQALDETRTPDAQISISIRMHDRDHVLVEIADNGPGIPPQHLHRIFTPFFTTKGSSTGTGLGLSISQRIITGFGGEIILETNRPRGACFRIVLPIAKELEPNRRAPTPLNIRKRGRVLVIDDDPLVGSTIRRVLSPVHEVETTSSGRAAVERLRHGERFDLILSDIEVTEQGSVDLYHELLAFAPEQAERITFVTRGVPNTQQKKFLDQVSNPRIEKPFDLNQLRALLPTEEPNKAP